MNPQHPPAETKSIDKSLFQSLEETLHDLLCAAGAVQEIAQLMEETGSEDHPSNVLRYLGDHIQNLRNKAAKDLEPFCVAHGVQPIGY